MGRYKTLAKNSTYVFIGNIGSKLISFLMLPFYTSWMSVEEYGATDMVVVYMSLLMPFVTFCLTDAIFVFPAKCKTEKQSQYFSTGIAASVFSFSILALVFAIIEHFDILGEQIFSKYIWYIYLLLITGFLQSYFQQFCMALDKMFIFSMSGIVLTACTALFGFLMIPVNGAEGFLISLVTANIITILFTCLVVRLYRYVRIKRVKKSLLAEMLKYTVPLIPNALMWWLISSFNRVTMEHSVGVYFIGLYAVASKIPSILTSLFNPLTNAWKLSVVQEYGKPDFDNFYSNIGGMLIMTISLGAVIFGLFSEAIIDLFTASDYHGSWIYSPILILSLVFIGIGAAVDPIFIAIKHSKYFLWSSIVGAIVGVALNFILIPIIGIWGAVISLVGAHFFISLTRLYFAEKHVQLLYKKNMITFVALTILVNIIMTTVHNYLLSISLGITMIGIFYCYNKNHIGKVYSIIKSKYDKRKS